MFTQILVPVDLSDRNAQAVQVAVEMAQSGNGRVQLLHIIKLIAGGSYEEFEDFYQKLESEAEAKMAALVQPYAAEALEISSHILLGNRVEEILNFAIEHETDLIVMNSHKIDLQNPDEGWGSISHKVSILSQCPILLVK
jgi:universal stress protein A